ncbi:MAG: DUF4157 domain-containing protein [Anaerolineae bacterium]|nr:DUF4157 domain-containing protein [Anaerolineae bacterium]
MLALGQSMTPPSLTAQPNIFGSSIQRKCACGGEAEPDGECAECKAEREAVQRQAADPAKEDSIPPSVTMALQSGGGQSLDRTTRSSMEQAFGVDFRGVRVHTGAQASQAARDINATAFTHGQDIFFDEGKFQPGTSAGDRLLAHELTHTIQQRGNGRVQTKSTSEFAISQPGEPEEQEADLVAEQVVQKRQESGQVLPISPRGESKLVAVVQRNGPAGKPSVDAPISVDTPSVNTNGPTSNTTQTSGVPPEVAHRLAFAATVMRAVPRLSEDQRHNLERLAGASSLVDMIRERDTLAQSLDYERALLRDSAQLAPGESLPGGVALSADQVEALATQLDEKNARIQEELAANGITDEAELHRLIAGFPQQWIERGKQIAYTMLDQNQAIVLQEQERYEANVCSPDVEGLLAADQELAALTQQIDILRSSINTAQAWLPSAGVDLPKLPPHMASLAYDIQHLPENRQLLEEKTALLEQRMKFHALKFPIMWSKDYIPGSLSEVSSDEMARLTGQWAQNVLDNIAATRKNIADDTIKVWDMPEVYPATFQDLGISESSFLGTTVLNYIRDKNSDAFWLGVARAALGITAGLIATFASGGLALVAFGVGAGLGAWQLIDDVNSFRAESSAEQVALDDPIIADISVNEPNLLPVVLDVIGLGLDVGGIVGALRTSARALSASGDITEFANRTRRLVEAGQLSEEAGEELIARAARRLEIPGGASTGGGPGVPIESPWPHVAQRGPDWCGAACGEMAAGRLGVEVTQEQILKIAKAKELFQEPVIIDGKIVVEGGFHAKELGKALEAAAPVSGRDWLGGTLKADISTPARLQTHLNGFLQSTESSIILRVTRRFPGDHWIVVDQITSEGLIAIRDPARQMSMAVTAEELSTMGPTGDAVFSFIKR